MYSRTRDEGFGPEVKRRIMLGTYVLSAGYYDAFYLKAQQVRTLLRRDYEHAFASVDIVAMPTTPTPPFRLGEKTEDPLQMYLARHLHREGRLAGADVRDRRLLAAQHQARRRVDHGAPSGRGLPETVLERRNRNRGVQ
jgi:Asp-tRNA(Asn)/Glu-tRNA(Gln) amidotransferase A subunit family amidase